MSDVRRGKAIVERVDLLDRVELYYADGTVGILEGTDAVCRDCDERIYPDERLVDLEDGGVEHYTAALCRPDCRCSECASIHSEFISAFGKWPTSSHKEGQQLAERRRSNERSWDRATRGDGR